MEHCVSFKRSVDAINIAEGVAMIINHEGRAAFDSGSRVGDSPYDDTVRRIQWVKGWCDSKHDHESTSVALATRPIHREFIECRTI
jgi:ribosome modulation factor